MSFWETLPGLIASWAAALAGVLFLAKHLWRGAGWCRRLSISVARLIAIGDKDAWPNGSETLPESITEIYNRQTKTNELIEAYIKTHRQDHELL